MHFLVAGELGLSSEWALNPKQWDRNPERVACNSMEQILKRFTF
jgi:hypothetical protein